LNTWNYGSFQRTTAQCKQKLKDLKKKYQKDIVCGKWHRPVEHSCTRQTTQKVLLDELAELFDIEEKHPEAHSEHLSEYECLDYTTQGSAHNTKNECGQSGSISECIQALEKRLCELNELYMKQSEERMRTYGYLVESLLEADRSSNNC
jgi:uncharacterized protein YpbB